MSLKLVYRSCGPENRKNRPAYYSKLLCLQSFLRAARQVEAEIVFVNDGPIPDDRLGLMRAAGEIVTLPSVGLRGSYRAALALVRRPGWGDDDVVWFSEDDYLYRPEAFRLLPDVEHLRGDYVALFGATPDLPLYPDSEPGWIPRRWAPVSYLYGGTRWVQTLSTASSFGARVGALRQDLGIFRQAMYPHRTMLRDHDTCVVLQGHEPHSWRRIGRDAAGLADGGPRERLLGVLVAPFKVALNLRSHRRRSRRRALMAPEPNLATHLEVEWISPGHDWAALAADTRDWAERTLPAVAPRPAPVGGPAAGDLRVLVVESSLKDNGGLRVSLDNAARWTRHGVRVALDVLQEGDGPRAHPDPSLPVRFLAPATARFRHVFPPALARLTRDALRSDVVLSGSDVGFGLLGAFVAARLARRPFAVMVQSDLDEALATWATPRLRPVLRAVHRRADLAVCSSQALTGPVVANGLPSRRTAVVGAGIDVDGVRRRLRTRPARPAGDPPVVLGLGRLCPQKDFELLVRAHHVVVGAGVPHQLRIVGDGPSRRALEDLVRELGVSDTVALPGYADDALAEIGSADLFVLSSGSEGRPLVLQEVLTAGTPVIATRCGSGVVDLLDDGRYGALVPPGRTAHLARRIAAHLTDPEDLRARARRAAATADRFDAGAGADLVLARLARLTGTALPARGTPADPTRATAHDDRAGVPG